jgi:hypothetical protein
MNSLAEKHVRDTTRRQYQKVYKTINVCLNQVLIRDLPRICLNYLFGEYKLCENKQKSLCINCFDDSKLIDFCEQCMTGSYVWTEDYCFIHILRNK